jgi:hypothetical protein
MKNPNEIAIGNKIPEIELTIANENPFFRFIS